MDYQLKYVCLGDNYVGKSSLVLRYVQGKYRTNLCSTNEVDPRYMI